MRYVVKSRELKWAGKTLLKGSVIEPQGERDHRHIELLVKIGKAEAAPEPKPVRKVSETKPAPAPEPVEAAAVLEIPAAPEAEAIKPRAFYGTRRLKAEG